MGFNNKDSNTGYAPQNKSKSLNQGKEKDYANANARSNLGPVKSSVSTPSLDFEDEFDFFSQYSMQPSNTDQSFAGPYLPGFEPDSKPTYVVKKNDTLSGIADKQGITLVELLFENEMQLLDPVTGKVMYQGNETYIQAGMVLKLPEVVQPKEEEQEKKIESKELNQVLDQQANSSSDPLRAVLKALLDLPMKLLGSTKGSKVAAEFSVKIPIPAAPVVKIILGGSFEQERKENNKTLVTHKVEPKLGVSFEGKVIEGEVTLFGLFEVTSANLDDAVSLIYYGLYKLGRVTGDTMNDWEVALATQGKSFGLSMVMFCGLNLLYSEDDKVANAINGAKDGSLDEKSFLDKVLSATSAEANVAAMEAQLFGKDKNKSDKPFDEQNKNEVAFGGGIEGKISVGDEDTGSAEASAKVMGKTIINAQTLNTTGTYGEQQADFTDDYKIGGLKELELEFAGKVEVMGNALTIKHVFTWEEKEKEVIRRRGQDITSRKEIGWGFKSYKFEIGGELAGISKLADNTTITLIEQLVEKGVAIFNEKKEQSKENDPQTQIESIDGVSLAENAILELGIAEAKDMYNLSNPGGGGPVKVVDKLAVALKFEVSGGSKNPKAKVELSFGRIEKVEVDIEVAEFGFTDFDVLGTIQLQ